METSAPPAGTVPIGKPMKVPRSHGFQDRFQSSLDSQAFLPLLTGMTSTGPCRSFEATYRASPRAKRPTATRTMSMPSTRVGLSKVKRCCAVLSSMPIIPMNSPRASDARPRSTEAPSRAPTVRNATTMSAT